MKKPIVIAIAAVSGGGKTTVVKELMNQLSLSSALYFDDYEFEQYPKDFFQWVQSGANYNEWNIEKLIVDIEALLNSSTLNYIILDYPFAYKNEQGASYIDYTIFIDTPLDVALARRLLRDFEDEPFDVIKNDLDCYLSFSRVAYLEMLKSILPNSDLVIDGCLPLEEKVNQIINKVAELKSVNHDLL